MANLKIKKGDKVMVLSGKDKGKSALVERVFSKTNQVLVMGMNTVKKHTKATKQNPAGGVIESSRPLQIGKVIIICPSCGKPTRVGFTAKGKNKERICKKCGKAIHIQKENPKGDK
jgi:large subunit ribosomal protein L24